MSAKCQLLTMKTYKLSKESQKNLSLDYSDGKTWGQNKLKKGKKRKFQRDSYNSLKTFHFGL